MEKFVNVVLATKKSKISLSLTVRCHAKIRPLTWFTFDKWSVFQFEAYFESFSFNLTSRNSFFPWADLSYTMQITLSFTAASAPITLRCRKFSKEVKHKHKPHLTCLIAYLNWHLEAGLFHSLICLMAAKTDRAFKEFLEARNPTKQHSSTLESYLIKPVQRVLKYPLLLRELVSLTDPESDERNHLTGVRMHNSPNFHSTVFYFIPIL